MTVRSAMAAVALAMCFMGVGTSSAWAVHDYEAPLPTKVFGGEGSGTQEFTFGTITVKCSLAGWEGKQPTPATSVEDILKSYGGCKLSTDTVFTKVSHCVYDLLEPKGTGPVFEAGLSIINSGGSCEVIFEDPGVCILKFGAQSFEGPQLTEKNTSAASMQVNFSIKKALVYSHSLTCTGVGTGKDGSYTGQENIEGLIVT